MEDTMGSKTDIKPKPQVHVKEGSKLKLLVCFCGIFFSYLVFGILLENITRGKYGPDEEKFTFTLALVFVQCVCNAGFARIALSLREKEEDTTKQSTYALMTFSYVTAMLASNHALQYVNYPTQVLGKSVKPIPILILGVLFARKKYPLQKYLFVLMIVSGVAMFVYKDKKNVSHEDHQFGMGEILLLVSLLMDGMTGAVQDRARSEHRTQAYPMMLNMNVWSILYLGTLLVLTGEGISFTLFSLKYPHVIGQLLLLSIASAIGQNFIFMTVATFGPLMCSIITTTRKFFTILGSVIIFQHPMLARQWAGTFLVFIGLGLDSAYGKEKKDHVKK